MRSFCLSVLGLLSFAGLSALASPAPSECLAEYCPDTFLQDAQIYTRRSSLPTTASEYRRELTNAERFARGLSPNPPSRRGSARRGTPSSVPKVTKKGVIRVVNAANSDIIGYVSKNSFSGAQFRHQPSLDDALIIEFNVASGATSVPVAHIKVTNSDTGFPLLGFIQGRDDTNSDVGPSSFHYLYFGGVADPGTPPASIPSSISNSYSSVTGLSRTVETDVWSINLVTGAFTGQWINSDGGAPSMSFWSQGTALYAGGDSGAFVSRYPAAIISLKFVFEEL